MLIKESLAHLESKEYKDDLRRAREDTPRIVEFLRANVPEELREEFRRSVLLDPYWVLEQHLGFGMYIRNLLRGHGFSYDSWVMDDSWFVWAAKAFK